MRSGSGHTVRTTSAPSGATARIRANLAALSTLRDIARDGRPATAAEQAVLARWSGWGAVPEVFDTARQEFTWAREELAGLLTPEELAAAARNTLNAHYTDADLVRAIWTAYAARLHRRPGAGTRLRIRELHRLRPRGAEVGGGTGTGDRADRRGALPGRADPQRVVRHDPRPRELVRPGDRQRTVRRDRG